MALLSQIVNIQGTDNMNILGLLKIGRHEILKLEFSGRAYGVEVRVLHRPRNA